MFRKTSILLFLLSGLLTTVSLGQNAANVSMQISARVINPVGVSSSQLPNKFEFDTNSSLNKGLLKLEGTEKKNTLVELPETLNLVSEEGNILKVNVQLLDSLTEEQKEIAYSLNEVSKGQIQKGKYNGEVTARVIYF